MSALTPEQVLALAPDPASASSGRELSSPAKWESAGRNQAAVWGEAKGSGKNPYQTAVDLGALAYKCSCPSRKIPCKHALGLLLRLANGEIAGAEPPAWVTEWLEKRGERAVKQVEKSAQPTTVDPEAAAKRSEKRWQNILAGLEECEAFLSDVVSQGLLASQSARSWDQMAARMVDAQAPGIGLRLKKIGARVGVGEGWARSVAGQLGSLALLIEAVRRLDSLDENLALDVRSSLGIPTRKDDLATEPMIDVWDVLGQATEIEDRLTVYRSWLRSRTDGRWAMHMSFSVAGQPSDFRPLPGSALAASLQYFPSAYPLRAHVGDRELVPFGASAGGTWQQALNRAADVWSRNPWVDHVPVLLSGSRLARDGDKWLALDSEGSACNLVGPEPWELLAHSGNGPSELFGEWNGQSLRLLGAWGEWGYLAL